jgi:Nucleotidyl transferase of unknown function (DUF2204)
MHIQQDFEELLGLLEEYQVRYLVIGGYAVAFHGYPRFTKDLDIFYDNSQDNINRLRNALLAFGFTENDIPPDVFAIPGNILTFGIEPVRIDLINKIDGIEFSSAYSNRSQGRYGKFDVAFIGKQELLINKRSTKRLKDKADVEELG